MGSEPVTVDDESVCGETFDHDLRVTYEDEDVRQYECLRCGAELWEDAADA